MTEEKKKLLEEQMENQRSAIAYDAKKNAEVLTYILGHYGSFVPQSLLDKLEQQSQSEIRLIHEIEKLENDRRAVSSRIRDKVSSFHRNRVESVSFLDFIYYSICVSTTVSFGDIAPNDGWSRFIAIVELLSCLFLVGVILDGLKQRIG